MAWTRCWRSLGKYWTRCEHLLDRRAGQHLLEEVAAGLVGVEVDVRLAHAAEEVVRVAEDVLVGADEEDAEAVRLAGRRRVELERALDAVGRDEARHLAVRVARDVDEAACGTSGARRGAGAA